jgi:hypothetical protein
VSMRRETKNGTGYLLNNLRGLAPKVVGRRAVDVVLAAGES